MFLSCLCMQETTSGHILLMYSMQQGNTFQTMPQIPVDHILLHLSFIDLGLSEDRPYVF